MQFFRHVLLLSPAVLLTVATIQAQDTTVGARTPRREVQLYVGNQRLGTYEDMLAVGVWYRKPLKGARFIKYGAAYVHYEERGTPFFQPAGADSIRITRQYTHANLGLLGIGVEQERRISGKLLFYAGIEGRAGYGSGGVDSTASIERAPAGIPQTSFPDPVSQGISLRTTLVQARGYLGIRSVIRRFTAGVEVGGFLNGFRRAYSTGAAITDLSLGTDYRATIGYRF